MSDLANNYTRLLERMDSACAASKRDGVMKKLAKYNEKSGDRIGVAWAI